MGDPALDDAPLCDVVDRIVSRCARWSSLDARAIGDDVVALLGEEVSEAHASFEVRDEAGGTVRCVRGDGTVDAAVASQLVATAPPLVVRVDETGVRAVRLALSELAGQVVVASRDPRFPDRDARALLAVIVGHASVAVRLDRERVARAALEEAARRRDELLTVLAHEVRNPLAAVVTASELLEHAHETEDETARAIRVVGRQGRHAARLLDGLLEVARVGRGITLDRAPIDLAELVKRTVEAQRERASQRAMALSVTAGTEPIVVDGDPVRLMQVVNNLVTNALKYTPPGGRVEVALAADDRRAELTVRDNGVGMEPDEVERVFGLFERGAGEASLGEGGLGIGLSIVRDIVSLHGGEVRAESDGRGRGTRMVVRLPRVHAAARKLSSATLPATSRRGLRLLVVDDNEDAAEMLARLVERVGHRAAVAHDGPKALAEAERFRPEVALIDLGMPGMDGIELGSRLSSMVVGIGLVAVTGYGGDGERARTQAAGFFRHLVKPVRLSDLEAALSEWAQEAAATSSTPPATR